MATSSAVKPIENPELPVVVQNAEIDVVPSGLAEKFTEHRVIRRNGQLVPFDCSKITKAITQAFNAVAKSNGGIADLEENITKVVDKTLEALWSRYEREKNLTWAIEDIQDQVELAFVRTNNHKVGDAYSKYREEHAEKRRAHLRELIPDTYHVIDEDGNKSMLETSEIHRQIEAACHGLHERIDSDFLIKRIFSSIHDDITQNNLDRAMVLEASTLIERHHDYAKVAARLLLDSLITEVMGHKVSRGQMNKLYAENLTEMINRGIKAERINPKMRSVYDLKQLGAAIKPERDDLLDYLGLQTLYDRYFIKVDDKRIELPQTMFMRVAMGLALEEIDPNARAIEFYELLSSFNFMSSTPTLFNAGTTFSQLSSCYLSTVPDDLDGIYGALKDNALLSKYAGGLGNDWTPVRAMGSYIKGTGGKSQGVVPFLRVVNDTAVAVNQGGKRKGAVCSYLETWHRDIEEFQDLRKNTGDERRRTHDMNTANWIPDLFMQRVREKGKWVLFSPNDTSDLHDLYGKEFKYAYLNYELQFHAGMIDGKEVEAFELWRHMLRMLFETGHPWITFKDPCNIRSPQKHAGVVHSSNLCTEITLNTNESEIAVCNLGSINLGRHLNEDGKLDEEKVKQTVTTAMRMLDNVIDINYYAVDKARDSNYRHRPVGLGQVGFQDCLNEMGVAFDSDEAIEFADYSTELICYHSYWASSDLAKERGKYQTYEGSDWSKGKLPLDTLKELAHARSSDDTELVVSDDWLVGDDFKVNVKSRLDWEVLREKIKVDGMRNSNCIAIAPTATIGNIMGASPCIEPTYKNLYAKSNLSGEFVVINKYLIDELIKADIWDDTMRSEIKTKDGEIAEIERIPAEIRSRYKSCFQIDQKKLVEAASRRQKWIDQSQSLNLFVHNIKGKELSELYMLAWERGLKTTYYCRTLAVSKTEKFTTNETGQQNKVAVPTNGNTQAEQPKACVIDDPDCEACQ